MTDTTNDPTVAWIGKTYMERDTTKRWLVLYVEPCNEWFYRLTGANPKIPRWDVTVQRLRIDGTLGSKITSFALTADTEMT